MLSILLEGGVAGAAQMRMSGRWLSLSDGWLGDLSAGWHGDAVDRVNIPLYFVALGPTNRSLLGLGDPHIPGSGFVNVTKAGTGPATITVPPGVFHLETARAVPLKAALSGLFGPGEGGRVIQATSAFSLNAPVDSAVFEQSATSYRLVPDFSFCPGAGNNPECLGPYIGGFSGTRPGRVVYTAGPNRFGGTMQMLIRGSSDLAVSLGSPPLRIRHDRIPVVGPVPQAVGGAYATITTFLVPAADITTGATFTPNGLIGIAGTVTGMATTEAYWGTGFPWTTGRVQVQVPVTNTAPPTTITLTGSDDRTPNGRGTITMVAGGLSQRISPLGGIIGRVGEVRLEIASSQLTPSLSPLGIAALGSMLVIGGGYALRRRGLR